MPTEAALVRLDDSRFTAFDYVVTGSGAPGLGGDVVRCRNTARKCLEINVAEPRSDGE